MNNFLRIIPTFFLLVVVMIGCRFTLKSELENTSSMYDSTAIVLAKQSLKFISENKSDSLKNLLDPKVRQRVKADQLDLLINEGQRVLENYYYPNDTSIKVSQSVNYSMVGKNIVSSLSLPFQHKNHSDSIKYFHVSVSNNQILRLILNDYPPGLRIIEPKRTEPHLERIDLNIDNLSWFRIWYDDGAKIQKRYGLHKGFYAVSGNYENLRNYGIRDLLQKTFDQLNSSEFDSLDFKYLQNKQIGDPEYVRLRMRFNNEGYKNLGEFELYCFLDQEVGKDEDLFEYIIFKHTEKTRYLLLKEKNQELLESIKELVRHDYTGNYELNP